MANIVGRWLIEESQRAEAAARQDDVSPEPSATEELAPGSAASSGAGVTVPLKLGDQAVRVTVNAAGDDGAASPSHPVEVYAGPQRDDEPAVPRETWEEEPEIDLALVEQRCRLKAESCRLFIDRRAAAGDPVAEAPFIERMDEMIAQAKAMPNCFLWVFWRERTPPDDASLRTIAACYDALAETASLMRRVDDLSDRLRDDDVLDAMQLLAEADSALRIALEPTWLTAPDQDQDEVHRWIRRESDWRRIYVPRYMKLDDPADPDDADDVIDRAQERREEIEEHASRLKQIDEGFKKIRYHADLLEDGGGSFDRHHSQKIAEAVGTLESLGVPPSDRRYRDALDPGTTSAMSAETTSDPAVASVIEYLNEWHDSNGSSDQQVEETDIRPRWSSQVVDVRSLLRGRSIVIVGGEPRNEAIDRIRDAFHLADVEWVRLSEHGSGEPMRAPIMRPETALVLVIVKLAGHLHTEEANGYAREAGVPAVYLKAGYNPERIADAVLQQASEQLRQSTAPAPAGE